MPDVFGATASSCHSSNDSASAPAAAQHHTITVSIPPLHDFETHQSTKRRDELIERLDVRCRTCPTRDPDCHLHGAPQKHQITARNSAIVGSDTNRVWAGRHRVLRSECFEIQYLAVGGGHHRRLGLTRPQSAPQVGAR